MSAWDFIKCYLGIGNGEIRESNKEKPMPRSKSQQLSTDDIITLTNADGEDIDFIEVAGISYKGGYYAILQPVNLLDGMKEDEALVFRVNGDREGTDQFELETDDGIVDGVFEEYNRLLDEQEEQEG